MRAGWLSHRRCDRSGIDLPAVIVTGSRVCNRRYVTGAAGMPSRLRPSFAVSGVLKKGPGGKGRVPPLPWAPFICPSHRLLRGEHHDH